jgi:hypothetical protein
MIQHRIERESITPPTLRGITADDVQQQANTALNGFLHLNDQHVMACLEEARAELAEREAKVRAFFEVEENFLALMTTGRKAGDLYTLRCQIAADVDKCDDLRKAVRGLERVLAQRAPQVPHETETTRTHSPRE